MNKHSELISTKPHMIKLRNNEYAAHQKNLMRVMGGRSAFVEQSEPIIRRKDKYLVFDKQQYSRLLA
jgi:hypothetical protein